MKKLNDTDSRVIVGGVHYINSMTFHSFFDHGDPYCTGIWANGHYWIGVYRRSYGLFYATYTAKPAWCNLHDEKWGGD